MSKIIHLKDYSSVYQPKQTQYTFEKAFVSNSRLMGVIGIRMHFKGLTLFFHLDYEEYGFDRFEAYHEDDPETIKRITQSFIGGLGAELVEINLEEASSLIYEAAEKGTEFLNDVPLEFFDYEYLLDEFCKATDQALYKKISTELVNDYERIHYYLMRSVGKDYKIRDLLLSSEQLSFEFNEEPTLLLKNEIKKEGDYYICKAVMDFYDKYKMIVVKLKVDAHKIIECEIIDDLLLTVKEASFQLNKKEQIMICHVEHVDLFKRYLEKEKPSLLKNVYEGGSLYTAFKPHNHHVQKQVYYLNEDVYGIFYVTDTNQMVISSFDEQDLEAIKTEIENAEMSVDILMELEAESPILYDFVTSGLQDFFDFLGE